MNKLNFLEILEETFSLKDVDEDNIYLNEDEDETEDDELENDDDETEEDDEDLFHQGTEDYSADDFREIIDYVKDLIDLEDDNEINNSVDEIGLALLYDYADVMPQTLINQMVEDLKEIFEIEDEMMESLVTEGFVKKKKGVLARKKSIKAAKIYKAKKAKIKLRASKWRRSARGKKVISIHKKLQKRLGKRKGMRLVSNLPNEK
ncbi:hypothetical protein GW796_05495 [archaeon]|nr:hypothetical protein [archaeon]NCQ51338.1 hypothetical protein [archaeon]NCT58836.1 hypothetical protein [archaeon]